MMRSKKIIGMLLAVVVAITSIPITNVTAAAQPDTKNAGNPAEESKFLVTFDAQTGGITSMKLDNDPNKGNSNLELNWANGSKNTSANGENFGDTTWGMGPLYNSTSPTTLEITDTKSEAVFQTENTKVEIVRELKDDNKVIEETYTFTNTSDSEVAYEEGDLGIYVPFNDYYEASNLATERRCNTHIWAGENYSYIYAVRMGGNGPHVGLVLTQGSMASYGQVGYTRSDSNDRGKFIFNNDAMTLEADESYTVSWKIFAHDGEEDFYKKLDAQTNFVRLESDYYTKEKEKGEAFSITAISGLDLTGSTLQARKVSYRNKAAATEFPADDPYSPVYGEPIDIKTTMEDGKLSAEFQPDSIGEYVVELTTPAGKKAICKLNYVSSMDRLLETRVNYILDHQQMLDSSDKDRYGGFFPYNTRTNELETHNNTNDHTGARERIAMPITLALYYQITDDEELKARIKTSLELFWEYAKREIINTTTGQCFDNINYGGGGREYNSPNYAWMCMEVYKVIGKTECVDVMMQILRYLRDTYGRRTAYIINMNILENLEFLYDLGRYDDYAELYEYYIQCGDWIVEDLPNYPSLEVKYEQSIVTPTVENIAAIYYLTGDEKYKEAVETHYKRMMALEGNQPSYFQNRIGIRHWDDYWFGAGDYTCGDTLHYWSALDARALKVYDMCMGTDHSRDIKNIYMNNLANIAEDGRGFCAYLISKQNNTINGQRYNELANDQDYALAIALKNYIMPQETFQRKFIVRYNPNNIWVQDQEHMDIIAEGATITSFPQIDLEDNRVLSWNTEKDGSGTTITLDTPIQENLTLYAQWEYPVEDIIGDMFVEGKLAETSGQVNLTEEGNRDWVQFGSNNLGNHARKNIDEPLITNISAIQGTSELAKDGAFSYTYSDAADGVTPQNNYGIVAKGLDNGFEFKLPSSSNPQRLKVYAGAWGGDVTFELLVNGIVQYQETFGKDTSSGAISQSFEVTYTIPESVNTITGRLYCTKNLDQQWGGCSVILQAITLGETEKESIVDLGSWIAFMEALNKDEYTFESWATLQAAIDAAKAVQADENATRTQMDQAVADLIAAFGGLEYGVQKTHLQIAVDAAQDLINASQDYEGDSIETLQKVLEDAKAILADTKATQEAVNEITASLIDAIVQVAKEADLVSLESLIAAVESLDEDKYTSESWAALMTATEEAMAVLDDSNRADGALADAYANLADAIRGLQMKGNKTALDAVINKAKTILENASQYVASSISGLNAALEAAQTVYDNENAVQFEVNTATESLTKELVKARLLGDVNHDGKVTTSDSVTLLRYHAELDALDAHQLEGADVNGDGIADTKDVVLILQYASEKIKAF